MKKVLVLIGCFFMLFTSCKKDKAQPPVYYISADIDGKSISFAVNNVAQLGKEVSPAKNTLYLYGADGISENSNAIAINISITQAITKGTYTGTADDSRYVGISYVAPPFVADQSNEYLSDFADGGLAVTISSITADGVQGTFRGTLYNNSKTKTITNGKFNLMFNR